jgi:hypothetical protein
VADAAPDPYAEAERLMRDAQRAAEAAAAAAGAVPPRGWDVPRAARADGGSAFPDLTALVGLVDGLRGTVPAELVAQLTDALRELLVALRAVLDYSIARLDRPAPKPVQVEDIPVR